MRVVLIVLVLLLVLPLHSWVVHTNLVHYRVSHASHSRVPENVASYAHPHDGGVKEGCSNLEQRVVDCPSGGMPHYPCRRSPQDRPPRRGKGLRVEPLAAHGLVKGKLELGPAVVDGGAGKEHRVGEAQAPRLKFLALVSAMLSISACERRIWAWPASRTTLAAIKLVRICMSKPARDAQLCKGANLSKLIVASSSKNLLSIAACLRGLAKGHGRPGEASSGTPLRISFMKAPV